MPLLISLLVADVRFLTIYACAKCGTRAQGSTVGANIRVLNTDELKRTIDAMPQSAYNMPTGWSNTYGIGFRCDQCTTPRG